MKKMICALLCALMMVTGLVMAEEKRPLPQVVKALCQAEYPDHAIAAHHGWGNEDAGQWALVLKKGEENMLCIAETEAEGPYRFTIMNPKALPQGDVAISLLIDTGGDALFYSWYRDWEGGKQHLSYSVSKDTQEGWGNVSLSTYSDYISGTASENHYHYDDKTGLLQITDHISDGNDNILSTSRWPLIPIPSLKGKLTLARFDLKLLPGDMGELLNAGSPYRQEIAEALLWDGWTLVAGKASAQGIYLLAEGAGGVRRVFIRKAEAQGPDHTLVSADLPADTWLDAFHSDRSLLLSMMRPDGKALYPAFTRQGETWGLAGMHDLDYKLTGFDRIYFGPGFVYDGGSWYFFGSHPWGDIRSLDYATLPLSLDEARDKLDRAGWAVVDSPNPKDRLHLRAKPQRTADSLGKYYSGTPVKVLARKDGWAQVDILGIRGYMDENYLAFGEKMDWVARVFPQLLGLEALEFRNMPVYTRPDEGAPVAYHRNIDHFYNFWIIGIVGEEWYHVYFLKEGIGGYMKQEWFWPGNG